MAELQVGIVMGSDSDLPVMKQAAEVLSQFEIGYEVVIASAHRAPHKVATYAEKALERGIKVIIAGAGGAAHLPGVIAALTVVPVIGVPINTKALAGADSLYSIAQMPKGIPVATMAIDGARNAGIFAAQILGVSQPLIREKLAQFKQELAEAVEAKDARLQELGIDGYLQEKGR